MMSEKLENIVKMKENNQEILKQYRIEKEEFLKKSSLCKKIKTSQSIIFHSILFGSAAATTIATGINGIEHLLTNAVGLFFFPNVANVFISVIVPDIISKVKTNMSFDELKEYVDNGTKLYEKNDQEYKMLSIETAKLDVQESVLRFKEENNVEVLNDDIEVIPTHTINYDEPVKIRKRKIDDNVIKNNN